MDEHIVDEQGKLILALCKNSGLRILNGRTTGDLKGCLTRYPSKLADNPSTIDYALCSELLTEGVMSFSVLPFNGLSDHCCLSLTIKSNISIDNIPTKTSGSIEDQLERNKYTFKFDKTRGYVFEQALKDDVNIEELRSILAQANNSEDVDRGVNKMKNILINAAKKASFNIRNRINKTANKQQRTQEWYNRECKAKQKLLRQCSKKLSISPFDREKRQNFVKARVGYKKACRKAESASRQKLTKKLIELGQNNPKLFWDTIIKMNNWGIKKTDPSGDISTKTWINYFSNLLNDEKACPIEEHGEQKTFEPFLDSMVLKEL